MIEFHGTDDLTRATHVDPPGTPRQSSPPRYQTSHNPNPAAAACDGGGIRRWRHLTYVASFGGAALCALAWIATASGGSPTGANKGDWPMWGGSPDRNMASAETNIPHSWDVEKGVNVKWSAPLGSQTYGNPVVHRGKVFVSTNNNGHLRPSITGDKGVVVCLDENTGRMIWQATHDKLPTGRVNDWPEQGICSTPWADGDRIYYVSNRCEVVCADINGFTDGKNDGPYKDEKYHDKQDADFIWVFDMIEEFGAFPHNLATCSPVGHGDVLYIATSNGVDEGHLNLPNPEAPDFIALNKKTGEILWEAGEPGEKVLHGSWSSPAFGVVNGRALVIFGGGDGWCYAYDAKTGKVVWKFDLNPKDSVWVLGGRGTRNAIISTPVIYDNKVFLAVGQDPEHGEGPGHLYCIDATKTGDVTETGRIWHFGDKNFGRTMSTVAIADGLLYASDLSGFLYCLDVANGKQHWKYDVLAAVWGSPYIVDGKVMLGDEDGEIAVLEHSKTMKELAVNDMRNSVYTTPVAANGVLFITNRKTLFAIEKQKQTQQ